MRVLVVGAGGVGSAFVAIVSKRAAYSHITVADIDITKAEAAVATATDAERGRIAAAFIDGRRRTPSPNSPGRCRPT